MNYMSLCKHRYMLSAAYCSASYVCNYYRSGSIKNRDRVDAHYYPVTKLNTILVSFFTLIFILVAVQTET